MLYWCWISTDFQPNLNKEHFIDHSIRNQRQLTNTLKPFVCPKRRPTLNFLKMIHSQSVESEGKTSTIKLKAIIFSMKAQNNMTPRTTPLL